MKVDPESTVTADNESGQDDGAAMCVVTTQHDADKLGLTPMLTLRSGAVSGCRPETMGIGPVSATSAALTRAALTLDDIDLIELNEAFAAPALAVLTEWKVDPLDERLDPNGSGVSLGHPVGATGARILMIAALRDVAATPGSCWSRLCIGGGQGLAAIFETTQ